MTEPTRADVLRRAVTLTAQQDQLVLEELFTNDATISAPGREVTSRDELLDELRVRDELLTDLTVEIDSLDIAGDHGYAEWIATAAPEGAPVTVRGVTVANFKGDRIVALRQYWDELALLEALPALPDD